MGGMRIFVGQKDEYVNRMEFLASDAEKTRTGVVELTDLKFNQGLAPELFMYTPPEGVAVNDMTEVMRKQMDAVRNAMDVPEEAEAPAAPAGVLKVGVPGPAFQVKTLDGKTIDLAGMRGKPVLLFFWATWHKASVAQLVTVNKLAVNKKGAIEVVALSLDEAGEAGAVRNVLKEKGISLNVAMGEKAVLDAYWITEIPSYVLLDADGKVVGSESKPKDLAALEKTVEQMTKK
jgi:peroxiredoxin